MAFFNDTVTITKQRDWIASLRNLLITDGSLLWTESTWSQSVLGNTARLAVYSDGTISEGASLVINAGAELGTFTFGYEYVTSFTRLAAAINATPRLNKVVYAIVTAGDSSVMHIIARCGGAAYNSITATANDPNNPDAGITQHFGLKPSGGLVLVANGVAQALEGGTDGASPSNDVLYVHNADADCSILFATADFLNYMFEHSESRIKSTYLALNTITLDASNDIANVQLGSTPTDGFTNLGATPDANPDRSGEYASNISNFKKGFRALVARDAASGTTDNFGPAADFDRLRYTATYQIPNVCSARITADDDRVICFWDNREDEPSYSGLIYAGLPTFHTAAVPATSGGFLSYLVPTSAPIVTGRTELAAYMGTMDAARHGIHEFPGFVDMAGVCSLDSDRILFHAGQYSVSPRPGVSPLPIDTLPVADSAALASAPAIWCQRAGYQKAFTLTGLYLLSDAVEAGTELTLGGVNHVVRSADIFGSAGSGRRLAVALGTNIV